MARKIYAFLTLLLMGLLIPVQEAWADLTITPIRVVFGPRDRSASVELLNLTDNTNTYRFGWLLLKATPQGRYEQVPASKVSDNDPYGVQNMIIFTPRQVTIEPHGHQIVRLSLRRPSDLPPGEYRAHLSMTRLANQETFLPHDPNAKSLDLALNANLGFSIPIIVRQGEDKDLKISLSNPRLEARGKYTALKVDINRVAGKFSSYGTVNVFWKPPKGDEKQIGTLANVALYPELKTRPMDIPLTTTDTIKGGKIRVVYIGKLEADGITWDEKTFPVGAK